MKSSASLRDFIVSALVSPTWLAFASLILVLPMHRLVVPHWPAPIFEFLLPDGGVVLDDDRDRAVSAGGMLRSRPLNAARIHYLDGRFDHGYVVAVRIGDAPPERPPEGMVWQPEGPTCEVGMRIPPDALVWQPCAAIAEVSNPNRMRFGAKLRLAVQQSVPFWRIGP